MTGKEELADLYYSNLDNFIDIEKTNEQVEIIKKELDNYQELKKILKKHMRLNDNFCGLHEERKYTFVCKHILSKKETKFLKNLLKELEENE